MKYGLQVYTVRDAITADFDAAFKAVKDAGYEYIELPHLFSKSADELKKYFDTVGLKVASIMFSPAQLENEKEMIISACKTLGCRFAVCPAIAGEFRNIEGFTRHAEMLDAAAEKLKSAGITLAYHNHAFEFDKLPDGRCGYDILFGCTKTMSFEPDVYWLAFGGQDPLAMMRKLQGRMPIVHLKDMAAGAEKKFCEVGCGVLSMNDIIALAKKMNVEFAFVEQDANYAVSSIESVKLSRKALR